MNQSYKKAFIVLTSLFFTWGLLTVLVDSLIPRLKEIFELTYFQAGLVQFAFFTAYFLISIPASFLLNKVGYKRGIMLGLGIMGIGCMLFVPAASLRLFPLFMLGYFTLAAGMTILQVAANPYVTILGDKKTASSRLNLAQAFNSLGTTIAPALGAIFILSDNIKTSEEISMLGPDAKSTYYAAEASAVQLPFGVLAGALILLAIFVLSVKLPQLMKNTATSNYGKALSNSKLMLGALGIFVYVGAEVAIGSYLVSYFLDMNMAETIKSSGFMSSISSFFLGDLNAVDGKAIVASFVFLYWGGAMVGRFIGSFLTAKFKPNSVLSVFAILAILFIVISMSTSGVVAMLSILAVGLFNSIMFPTIFSIAIEDLGELKPQGSGILCTAIVGGAIIPPLYGLMTDSFGFKMAFIVVILCYAYILFYGRKTSRSLSAES